MKTFAHKNAAGEIVGIGMIYMESGGYTDAVAAQVAELGEDAGIKAYGDSVRPRVVINGVSVVDPSITTVVIDTAQMPGSDPNAYDKTFRGAFRHGAGVSVVVDMPSAKLIAHDMRREKRAMEFAPLDIQATIPGQATAAEAARQVIRSDYAAIQSSIDSAVTDAALKSIVDTMTARP